MTMFGQTSVNPVGSLKMYSFVFILVTNTSHNPLTFDKELK